MFNKVFSVASVAPPRHPYAVLAKLQEEVGELAQEVNIEAGFLNKEPGKDGVIGEAVDVIIAALDMVYLAKPDITEEELNSIISKKVDKWKSHLPKS